jgi:hypothetical protein
MYSELNTAPGQPVFFIRLFFHVPDILGLSQLFSNVPDILKSRQKAKKPAL